MQHTKATIRKSITEGKLAHAAKAALEYAEYCGLADITNGLTVLNSQLKEHQNKWNAGLINYETFSLNHAQIAYGLTQWVTSLPDHPKQTTAKKKLLQETTFKKRIFYGLILIKILVILWLAYHWSTGGFTIAEFKATATLLIPAFAGLISVILADYLRQQQQGVQYPKYLSGPLVTFSYWLFPVYTVLLIFIIGLKAASKMDFADMSFWVAIIESILGGYVGQIVYSFFKKDA